MNVDPNSNEIQDDDGYVQGNVAIGNGFRTLLIVLMFLGLPVIGVLVYLNVSKPKTDQVQGQAVDPTTSGQSESPAP